MDLKQYFTKSSSINNLMVQLLGDVRNSILLEPSVGDGALLNNIIGEPKKIYAFDVDSQPFLNGIGKNNTNNKIEFFHECFIRNFLKNGSNYKYDAVIANPPYGLDFSMEYRKFLKEKLPHIYVKESYSLFLYMSLMQLKNKGRYVFLIPDSFLTNHRHASIREFLVNHARPTHIIRMPSKAFETINFQYASLCIIAGYREPLKENDSIEWGNFDKSDHQQKQTKLVGIDFIKNMQNGWSEHYLINQNSKKIKSWGLLGDIADCKTGIYTGNNLEYIGFDPLTAKRKSNGHPIDWEKSINTSSLTEDEKNYGIAGSSQYVPFIRGGHRAMFEQPTNGILWNKDAINFYKNNKKSRFQNSSFYFREGIAIPMVSSSRISASYINNSVFDQGVVGIFPHKLNMLNTLLLYLNSSMASNMMKSIVNGSANNSANYLKKLPIPNFNSETINKASELVEDIKKTGIYSIDIIDDFFEKYL